MEAFIMNKDQIKGTAKSIGGKVQQKAGKLVGSKTQQAKGLKNQAEGKAQKRVGDLKEVVKKARGNLKKARKKG
jgi:uncharacterized protein YjbJ (UPF0337 family)